MGQTVHIHTCVSTSLTGLTGSYGSEFAKVLEVRLVLSED